jgi:hypothetical protein
MTARHADTGGQVLDAAVLEHAVFDQVDRPLSEPRAGIDAGVPRRELGPAAQTRPIAADFRGRGAREKATVLPPRQADRAHRPAIDPCGGDADEESAVEARIVRRQGAITGVGVERHGRIMPACPALTRHFRTVELDPSRPAELAHNGACRSFAEPLMTRRFDAPFAGLKAATLFVATLVTIMVASARAAEPDKLTFATDWLAQAEHGGFYQAVAEGTYRSTGST